MDLLGGYNSDSDSDNDSENPPLTSQPKSNLAKPTFPTKSAPAVNPDKKTSTASNTATSGSKSASSSSSRKGKRLLKLQAVLPETIWNQLSNGNLQKDSDDEDSEEEDKKRTGKSRKREKPSGSKASQNPGDKSDLTNLLQALPMSKTDTGIGGGGITAKTILQDSDDFSNTVIGSTKNTNTSSSSTTDTNSSFVPLGAAFLTTTVETVRKKKSGPSAVRDIHGASSSVAVETVNEDDGNDSDEDHEPDRDHIAERTAPIQKPSSGHASVASASSVRRPGMSSTSRTSGGFARPRMAAPPVAASRYPQQPQPSYPLPPGVTPYASSMAANPPQSRSGGGKKSRIREMERMLRQGNLDGVTSDIHLEGQANVYQAPQELQQQSYQSHGVRMVPTAQYNAGMGGMTASTKVSGKQRGKNQMNALLSNAVSLEAERARNPLPQQKVHRANAKRKYGW